MAVNAVIPVGRESSSRPDRKPITDKISIIMTQNPRTHAVNFRTGLMALCAAAGLAFITGCATTVSNPSDSAFKFTVFHYSSPVLVKSWTYKPSESDSPEGASLNITTSMKNGDIDAWLSNWDNGERPQISSVDRENLQKNWSALKDGQVSFLNRVVSGTVVVMELSVTGKDGVAQKLQVPLKYSENRWWLTAVDPSTDFMNWETASPASKIVNNCDSRMLESFLSGMNTVAQNTQ